MTTVTPEATIAAFLISSFDDERLTILRTDAEAGKVPFMDCEGCLLGHAGIDYLEYYNALPDGDRLTDANVSYAYSSLGDGDPWSDGARNSRRHVRLVELCDAELARRAALRAEVVEHARKVALVEMSDLVEVVR